MRLSFISPLLPFLFEYRNCFDGVGQHGVMVTQKQTYIKILLDVSKRRPNEEDLQPRVVTVTQVLHICISSFVNMDDQIFKARSRNDLQGISIRYPEKHLFLQPSSYIGRAQAHCILWPASQSSSWSSFISMIFLRRINSKTLL